MSARLEARASSVDFSLSDLSGRSDRSPEGPESTESHHPLSGLHGSLSLELATGTPPLPAAPRLWAAGRTADKS
jgi:hypothetical protein